MKSVFNEWVATIPVISAISCLMGSIYRKFNALSNFLLQVIKVDKSAIDQLLAFDDDDDDEEESEEDDAEVRRHRRDFDGRMERALF